jgi:phage I-like protein
LAGITKGLNEGQRQQYLEDLQNMARDSRVVLPEGCDLKAISRSDGTRASIHNETITWADQAITITIAGQLTTTEGTEGFSSGQVQKQVLASILRAQEETFSTTVGEQALTDWAILSADWTGATLYPRWQIQDPTDLTAQGFAAKQLSDSIEGINRALAMDDVRIDIKALMEQTGLPIVALPEKVDQAASQKLQLAPTDIARVVTINEARASIGLPPKPGPEGDRPISDVASEEGIKEAAAEEAIANSIHTRSGMRLRSLRQAAPYTVVDDEPPDSFQIFALGDNESDKGNAVLTREGMAQIIARMGSRDVMIDLEHLSLDPKAPNYDPDARGHVRLEGRDDGLWAVEVKWNEDGDRRLRGKLQRYVSPAFYVDEKDNQTITELVNIALTSLPATTYGQPLVAANKGSIAMDFEQMLAALRIKLGLSEDAPIEEILVKVLDAMNPGTADDAPADEPAGDGVAEMTDDTEGDEEPEALADTPDEEEPATEKEKLNSAMALAKAANRRSRNLEKKVNANARAGLIRRNRAKLPGKLIQWAKKAPMSVLKDFLKDAPDFGEDTIREPEAPVVKLSREDLAYCERFGTDPEKVRAIRARDGRRG